MIIQNSGSPSAPVSGLITRRTSTKPKCQWVPVA
jgi:hypothetical protein